MKTNIKKVTGIASLTLLAGIFLGQDSYAASIPQTMAYQGYLKAGTTGLTGTYSLRLTLTPMNSSVAGSTCSQAFSSVSITNGIFQVVMDTQGTQSPANCLTSTFLNLATYASSAADNVAVTVELDTDTNTGNGYERSFTGIRLNAVPYAYVAQMCNSVAAQSITTAAFDKTSLVVGDANKTYYFDGTNWVFGALSASLGNTATVGTGAAVVTSTAGQNLAVRAGASGVGALTVGGGATGVTTVTSANTGAGALTLSATGAGAATTAVLTSNGTGAGAATVSSTGGGSATTLITSNGTGADAVNISVTGSGGGITLSPNGAGVITANGGITGPAAAAWTLLGGAGQNVTFRSGTGAGTVTVGGTSTGVTTVTSASTAAAGVIIQANTAAASSVSIRGGTTGGMTVGTTITGGQGIVAMKICSGAVTGLTGLTTAAATATVTCTGATTASAVSCSPASTPTGSALWSALVTATNTITIRAAAPSGTGAIPNANWTCLVAL